ncbi:MAG: signal recognition particle-docking protein FtsY [Candidatus Nanopelagicaceae bacterium]
MGKLGEFFAKFTRTKISPEDLTTFRELLIDADFGRGYTDQILEIANKTDGSDLQERIISSIKNSLSQTTRSLNINPERMTTFLITGVNGTGKTTTVAKIANQIKQSGRSVTLAACDTFRAAAVDQLSTWATRIGVPIVVGKENADPASVAFSAAEKALENKSDVLIIDTAGRLHNKENLMQELGKIERVVSKVSPIDEKLFVLDGNTGQNGIEQAKVFHEAIGISGIVVTKLDGSASGGIALAVERELQVPVKLIGFGEGLANLADFQPDSYLKNLFT